VVKSASDFEIIVNPPVPEGPGPVLVSLRLLKGTFPAPDIVFTYRRGARASMTAGATVPATSPAVHLPA